MTGRGRTMVLLTIGNPEIVYSTDASADPKPASRKPPLPKAEEPIASTSRTSYDHSVDFIQGPQNRWHTEPSRVPDSNTLNSELEIDNTDSEDPLELMRNLEDLDDDPDFDYTSAMKSSDSDESSRPIEPIKAKRFLELQSTSNHTNVTQASQQDEATQSNSQKLPGTTQSHATPHSVNKELAERPPQDSLLEMDSRRKRKAVTQRDKNTRKKPRDVARWLKTQAKEKRNTGQQYWSTSTKTFVPGRALKKACDQEEPPCKFKCTVKISEEERLEIFSRFWQIGDLMLQREFVRSNITDVNRSLDLPNAAARSTNQAFYLETENGRLRTCKKFFMATLGISHRWISTIKKKTTNGFLEEDQRGRHNNRKKVDTEILNEMRAHIQSIPRIQSHYLKEQTSKEYIEGNKTIRSIYRDYVDFCKEKSKPYGSEDKFRRIFNTEFNISKERRVCVAPLE